MSSVRIREIRKADNPAMANCIRGVFDELDIPKVGTAYEDKALNQLFETYDKPNAVYFVVEENGNIIGGAGIAPLDGGDAEICELQKMYFSKQARSRGLGSELITKCLEKAKVFGYKACYIETMPFMEAARKLYRKNGFKTIEKPLGDTGHYSCTVFMTKAL